METDNILLKIEHLNLYYKSVFEKLQVLYDVNLELKKGEVLGIVGESGSGKSQTVLSIMKLFGNNAIYSGQILYNGVNLLNLNEKEINKYRGNEITMAFQDSMSALNPYLTIREQLIEPLIVHKHLGKDEAEKKAIQMLDIVRIKDAKGKVNCYPHEFSGGMRQRVMIAMSLICHPKIFIADELTTALDVTTQNQILKFLKELQNEIGMSIIFITHDLRVLSQIADRVIVMYCGHIMEETKIEDLFKNYLHPYTKGLLDSIPNIDSNDKELKAIPGEIPQLNNIPSGCPFSTRCKYTCEKCYTEKPKIQQVGNNKVACFNYFKK